MPAPPLHLTAATARFWRITVRDFELEPHHLHLLWLACEALDRTEAARAILAADGLTVRDDRGNVRAHPMVGVESSARIAAARLIRELDLDVTPARGRPPALRSNRRG